MLFCSFTTQFFFFLRKSHDLFLHTRPFYLSFSSRLTTICSALHRSRITLIFFSFHILFYLRIYRVYSLHIVYSTHVLFFFFCFYVVWKLGSSVFLFWFILAACNHMVCLCTSILLTKKRRTKTRDWFSGRWWDEVCAWGVREQFILVFMCSILVIVIFDTYCRNDGKI